MIINNKKIPTFLRLCNKYIRVCYKTLSKFSTSLPSLRGRGKGVGLYGEHFHMKRIFVINPGCTSTKVAVYESVVGPHGFVVLVYCHLG